MTEADYVDIYYQTYSNIYSEIGVYAAPSTMEKSTSYETPVSTLVQTRQPASRQIPKISSTATKLQTNVGASASMLSIAAQHATAEDPAHYQEPDVMSVQVNSAHQSVSSQEPALVMSTTYSLPTDAQLHPDAHSLSGTVYSSPTDAEIPRSQYRQSATSSSLAEEPMIYSMPTDAPLPVAQLTQPTETVYSLPTDAPGLNALTAASMPEEEQGQTDGGYVEPSSIMSRRESSLYVEILRAAIPLPTPTQDQGMGLPVSVGASQGSVDEHTYADPVYSINAATNSHGLIDLAPTGEDSKFGFDA